MILGFCGFARVGKDTMGRHMIDKYGFHRYAFADELKAQYCRENGISPGQLEELKEFHRNGLIELSRVRKKNDPNYWIKQLDKTIDHDKVVITDVRFEQEIEWIHENQGVVIWLERMGYNHANEEERIFTRPCQGLCDAFLYNGDYTETVKELDYLVKTIGIA